MTPEEFYWQEWFLGWMRGACVDGFWYCGIPGQLMFAPAWFHG